MNASGDKWLESDFAHLKLNNLMVYVSCVILKENKTFYDGIYEKVPFKSAN